MRRLLSAAWGRLPWVYYGRLIRQDRERQRRAEAEMVTLIAERAVLEAESVVLDAQQQIIAESGR